MKLPGAGGQQVEHFMWDASGTIASSTAPQLLLPIREATSHLIVMNTSASYSMYLEIGSARAVATISNGAVSAVTVTNPGFGFSQPPLVSFRGGGADQFAGFLGATEPLAPPPKLPARGRCVMSGTAPNMTVASILLDDPGSGYLVAPYVQIRNAKYDRGGCADPSYGGGSGLLLQAGGGSYYLNGTVCPIDQMALYCSGGVGATFCCKWMD